MRLHEKGGKEHEVPCHHNLERYLDEYIAAAGIAEDPDAPLFQTAAGRTGRLTGNALWQQDAYRMIQRRAKAAGIQTRIGNHTFRATGITAYLKNSGTLETAQHIANHESPRTTKLYDRRQEEISLEFAATEIGLELTYTAHDMAPFARDMGYVDESGEVPPPFRWDDDRRLHLRAKLDALYFHLYDVTDRDDIRYVFSTFPIVEREEVAAYGTYRSRDLCLAWTNALAAGDPDAEIDLLSS